MDYTQAGLLFRLRKVIRYVAMYGVSRTLVKVRGQYHMRRRYEELPSDTGRRTGDQVFGLIGCGNYAFSNIAYYLHKDFRGRIRACMDTDIQRAASLAARYRIPVYSDDPAAVLDDPDIRLVFIASNHASHAEYAIEALGKGKSVYIEKPHAVNRDQLARLVEAARGAPGRVFLGFNRPGSRFGRLIEEELAREDGGSVINWFVAGHKIDPEHWYFKPEEGGRVLGNLCHWTDFTLELAGEGAFPVEVIPARHEQSDSNIAVSYVFANGTISVITFSAKGHTFEGVMERLAVHRGDALITMDDYRTMTVRRVHKKRRLVNWLRDHGHRRNITSAARSVVRDELYDRDRAIEHLRLSGELMLTTKEALEEDRRITLPEEGLTG